MPIIILLIEVEVGEDYSAGSVISYIVSLGNEPPFWINMRDMHSLRKCRTFLQSCFMCCRVLLHIVYLEGKCNFSVSYLSLAIEEIICHRICFLIFLCRYKFQKLKILHKSIAVWNDEILCVSLGCKSTWPVTLSTKCCSI